MGMVEWTTENVSEDMIDVSSETLMTVLSMSPEALQHRWKGELMYLPGSASDTEISVVLRKNIYGCEVKIIIRDKTVRRIGVNGGHAENRMVQMSYSQTLHATLEDMAEMQVAIDEGISVYRHPALWRKLNAWKEQFDLDTTEPDF